MISWVDVVARARGLSSRLLDRDRIAALAHLPDLRHLAAALADRYGPMPDEAIGNPTAMEQVVRLAIARELDILCRWCGARVRLIAPLLEDEDRRTLRSLMRRIAAGASPQSRIAGLLATPTLPRPLLALLARQSRLDAVASALTAWGSAYGSAMLPLCTGPHPDLFEIQLAIDRTFAARAIRDARQAGEPVLSYVTSRIDAANVMSARALAARSVEHDAQSLFIEGGQLVAREAFVRLAQTVDPQRARDQLRALLGGTTLAELAEAPVDESSVLDDRLLHTFVTAIEHGMRLDPLGLWPVVWYLLRLRAEGRDISRVIWGVALGAPPRRIERALGRVA